MRITFLALLLFGTPNGLQAACQNQEVSIEINLTAKTFDEGYIHGQTELIENDSVVITDLQTSTSKTYHSGLFEDDGAGNFGAIVKDINGKVVLDVFHDHETWDEDGLFGYAAINGREISLEGIKDCPWDQLFIIK